MKEENTTEDGIKEIKKLGNSYIELFRIKGIKKSADILTKLSYNMLNIALLKMSISFMGFALAIYLGNLFKNYALGFVVVGAVPLLCILLMRIFNKQTLRYFLSTFTRIITKDHD